MKAFFKNWKALWKRGFWLFVMLCLAPLCLGCGGGGGISQPAAVVKQDSATFHGQAVEFDSLASVGGAAVEFGALNAQTDANGMFSFGPGLWSKGGEVSISLDDYVPARALIDIPSDSRIQTFKMFSHYDFEYRYIKQVLSNTAASYLPVLWDPNVINTIRWMKTPKFFIEEREGEDVEIVEALEEAIKRETPRFLMGLTDKPEVRIGSREQADTLIADATEGWIVIIWDNAGTGFAGVTGTYCKESCRSGDDLDNYTITRARIILIDSLSAADAVDVGLHEMGHAFGLGHSGYCESIMAYTGRCDGNYPTGNDPYYTFTSYPRFDLKVAELIYKNQPRIRLDPIPGVEPSEKKMKIAPAGDGSIEYRCDFEQMHPEASGYVPQ